MGTGNAGNVGTARVFPGRPFGSPGGGMLPKASSDYSRETPLTELIASQAYSGIWPEPRCTARIRTLNAQSYWFRLMSSPPRGNVHMTTDITH